jgi:hypothetical protein
VDPLVAITQSARATSLRGEEIEKMPRERDFTSLATQATGANDERKLSGISIDGSSGAEDAYDQLEPGFSLSGPLVRGAFPGGAKMPEC